MRTIILLAFGLIFAGTVQAPARNASHSDAGGQIGSSISTDGTPPNTNAMLDVQSPSTGDGKGMLIPRVTVNQRTNASASLAGGLLDGSGNLRGGAAQGLIVYQTDGSQGLYFNSSLTAAPTWVYLGNSTTNYLPLTGGTMSGVLNMGAQSISNVANISFYYAGVAVGYGANGSSYGAALGYYANGYSEGAAMGDSANGVNYGAAMGYLANSYDHGAAVGYEAIGSFYGAAMGREANGNDHGMAVGYNSDGSSYGAAVGSAANGKSQGAAIGYQANGYLDGVAAGYEANGSWAGIAIGKSSDGNNFGVAVGRSANGANTNIAIGYSASANGGTKRTAIGYDVDNTVDNSMRVRGTLYLDGGTGVVYRATFGSGAWANKAFTIDHPLDPENKVLRHFCMEGPDVWNVYAGNAQLVNGRAIVQLPDYYSALNLVGSEIYSLTPIGGWAPIWVHVKVTDNVFVIAGQADLEVSWTIKVRRNDPGCLEDLKYRPVEQLKSELKPD